MMAYEIQFDENGEEDWGALIPEEWTLLDAEGNQRIMGMVIAQRTEIIDLCKFVAAHARAEERQRCAKLAAKLKDWATCEAILKEDKP